MRSRLFHAVIATGIALGTTAVACDETTATPDPVGDAGDLGDRAEIIPETSTPEDAGDLLLDARPEASDAEAHHDADMDAGDAADGDGGWYPTK